MAMVDRSPTTQAVLAVVLIAVAAIGSKIVGGGHGGADIALDVLTGGTYLACGVIVHAQGRAPALVRLLLLAAAAWFAEDFVTSRVPILFRRRLGPQGRGRPGLRPAAPVLPEPGGSPTARHGS